MKYCDELGGAFGQLEGFAAFDEAADVQVNTTESVTARAVRPNFVSTGVSPWFM